MNAGRMFEIFKAIWAWVRVGLGMVFRGLRRALILVLAAALLAGLDALWPRVPDEAILVLDPQGPLVEEPKLPAPVGLLFGGGMLRQTRVHDLVTALDRAAEDERIRLVLLRLDGMRETHPAKIDEVLGAMDRFRKRGKRIVAYGQVMGQSAFLLATGADEIWLHPLGIITLTGLSYRRPYLKDALDRLGLRAVVFRAGEYKSFAEPLVRNSMSAQARLQAREWLNGLWRGMLERVAKRRGMDADALQKLIDAPAKPLAEAGGVAQLARKLGLVDRLLTGPEAEARLYDVLGLPDDEALPEIGYRDYLRATGGPDANRPGKGKVAVIVASGAIAAGEQPPGSIGAETLAALLRQAGQDDSVRAVVLRIDSPGGEPGASEDLRRAILRLKAAGKPVVVSMSGVAASGGYWMASAATEIWAHPLTLTGSIGVFGIVGEASGLVERLGVHIDGVATSNIAGQPSAALPLSDEMRNIFQQTVDRTYRRFIEVVTEGRGMKPERVRELAGGRVWLGRRAKELGLVDGLGGLNDAIERAATLAGLGKSFGVRWMHAPRNLLEQMRAMLTGAARSAIGASGWLKPGIHAWSDLGCVFQGPEAAFPSR